MAYPTSREVATCSQSQPATVRRDKTIITCEKVGLNYLINRKNPRACFYWRDRNVLESRRYPKTVKP